MIPLLGSTAGLLVSAAILAFGLRSGDRWLVVGAVVSFGGAL